MADIPLTTYAIMKRIGVLSAVRLNTRIKRLSFRSPGFLRIEGIVKGDPSGL